MPIVESKQVLEVWSAGISTVIEEALEGAVTDHYPDQILVQEHWSAMVEELLGLSAGGMQARAEWRALSMKERIALMRGSTFSIETFCSQVCEVTTRGLARAAEPVCH